MLILGYLGSPRLKGKCSRLLDSALEGAASCGATVKKIELVKKDIRHCMGCCKCIHDDPDLKVGRCPIKDDMSSLLQEYINADGYIFASPVYDLCITSLMKKFLERKFPLTYRPKEAYATIGAARSPAEFKKSAALIVTGNCADEYRELMGDPCFEALEAHLIVEQVMTTDKLYVGGVENMTDATFAERLDTAHRMGARLVEEIARAQ